MRFSQNCLLSSATHTPTPIWWLLLTKNLNPSLLKMYSSSKSRNWMKLYTFFPHFQDFIPFYFMQVTKAPFVSNFCFGPNRDNYLPLICILLSFPLEFSVLITSCSELRLLLSSWEEVSPGSDIIFELCSGASRGRLIPRSARRFASPITWALSRRPSPRALYFVKNPETETVGTRGANGRNTIVSQLWALIKVGGWGNTKGRCRAYTQN